MPRRQSFWSRSINQPPLAIHGATPVFAAGPPAWPIADEAVRQALAAAWADGSWGRYHGPHCQALSRQLAELHQVEFATTCCSGTIAVELALRGVKVAAGDEVIMAGYDFPGNFRAITAIGATPVLVDLNPDNWSLDAAQLPAAVSPKTRAILVSHLHGGLADMPRIVQFAHANQLSVVEDACQTPGALVAGRMAGTWGDVGVLSFGGSKLLTAGRGGALLTNSAEIRQRVKVFSERGNDAFALSELQAAVLGPQVAQLTTSNATRQANVRRLLELVPPDSPLRPLLSAAVDHSSFYKLGWHYHPGSGETTTSAASREDVLTALRAEGVAMDAGFRGFTLRSAQRCRPIGRLEYARLAAANTIVLHHPILLADAGQIDLLALAIAKVAEASRQGFDRPPAISGAEPRLTAD